MKTSAFLLFLASFLLPCLAVDTEVKRHVPEPEPPTSDYYVACHFYPGWAAKKGGPSPFADALDFPERKPLLGY